MCFPRCRRMERDLDLTLRTFEEVSSSAECSWWCSQILTFALHNNPMRPEVYSFAFYLYGRLRLVRDAVTRLHGVGSDSGKRVLRPSDMITTRQLRIPVATDPHHLELVSERDCDVMMVTPFTSEESSDMTAADSEIPSSYVTSEADPPGLAILDSGCTRTMHGSVWAERFEAELKSRGLAFHSLSKKQIFKGVGGQIQSDVVKVYPIGLAKVHGEMCSSEAPGALPLLLSRPFMQHH